VTDIYAFIRMALETARKAAELTAQAEFCLTAQAELRLDLQPVVVCMPQVVTIVYVLLGDVCSPDRD
jgi:hypothetical protein